MSALSFDDNHHQAEATKMEGMLARHDFDGLAQEMHNEFMRDPQGFSKTLDLLKSQNDKDRQQDSTLPRLTIFKEAFGLGPAEQVVVEDSGGQKQEVWESNAHRQKELNEDPKSWTRALANMMNQGKWIDMPDYQKDATQATVVTDTTTQYSSGTTVRDFTQEQNDGQTRMNISPEELQERINRGEF